MDQDHQRLCQEAAEWIIELREEKPDSNTVQNFFAWLKTSPTHLQAYFEMSTAWDDIPLLSKHVDIANIHQQLLQSNNVVPFNLKLLPANIAESQHLPPGQLSKQTRNISLRFLSIAAAILIAILALFNVTRKFPSIYSTETGEQRLLTLEDGSTIQLNAQTYIKVMFDLEKRSVNLIRGQALFHVAKDPTRPFSVVTDTTETTAIGTQFDVYKKPNGATTVSVVEGKVIVRSAVTHQLLLPASKSRQSSVTHALPPPVTAPVLLSAGDQLLITKTLQPLPSQADVAAATAWVHGQLTFQAEPLSAIVDELNRYNPRQIIIKDPALRNLRVTGVFTQRNTALLLFLKEQLGLAVVDTGHQIEISKTK